MPSLLRSSIAELLGTGLLVCVVVGSGIMGSYLSPNIGVALLINAFSTVFALGLLILVIGPISGAHFNPAVTLTQWLGKAISGSTAFAFMAAQIVGAIAGSVVANLMFNQPALQISTHARVNSGTLIGEFIATTGLIVLIGALSHRGQGSIIPVAVPAWIGSAYFFTSSTSFANPAVTIGRIFSNTFAGIAPESVLPFVLVQLVAAVVGFSLVKGITSVKN